MFSILVVSCFIWNGALDSFSVILSYSTISLALHKSIILMSTLKHTHIYPALQFKLADMAGKISMSRLALRHAAELLDKGDPAATVHCALAKKIATEYGSEVCNDALQMHGG